MVAVAIGDIEAHTRPSRVVHFARVNPRPGCPAIGGTHGASKIGAVSKIGVLVGDRQRKWILAPRRTESSGDPCVVDVLWRYARVASDSGPFFLVGPGFLPHQIPGCARVRGSGYAHPFFPVEAQRVVGNIGDISMVQAGGNGALSRSLTRQYY